MKMCRDTEFVFCDGSGVDITDDLKAAPDIDANRIEVITFQNDLDAVRAKGKGHGEGQITKYALENSTVLRSAKAFAKCTGKLWVENFWSCLRAYKGPGGFSHFGFLSITAVDTRFFIAEKDFFRATLLDSYLNCHDSLGAYLENVYFHSLRAIETRDWMLPVYPRIRGLSGTSGQEYRDSGFKEFGKNLAIKILRTR